MRIFIKKISTSYKVLKNQAASKFIQSNRLPRKIFLISFAIVVIIFIATSLGLFKGRSGQSSTSRVNDERVEVVGAKASQTINKTFTFPLKDDKNVQVGKFKYVITDIQLQDQIIVKGQRATAVKGRTFLVVNFKIVNDSVHIFDINTRDYIRLSIEGENERFAADIHNDPVQVQAIATKPTRLGFPINDSNRKFILYVGEIKGEKKSININLK